MGCGGVRCARVWSLQLSLSARGSHSLGDRELFWELQTKVTLTPTGMRVDLTASNPGFTPLHVAPSLSAHVAVADVEGCFLIGCEGRKYLPHEVEKLLPNLKTGGWWQGLFGGGTKGSAAEQPSASPLAAEGNSQGQEAGAGGDRGSGPGAEPDSESPGSGAVKELLWHAGAPVARLAEETADYAALRGGMHRLFPGGPEDVTIVDRVSGLRLVSCCHVARLFSVQYCVL